MRRWFKGWRMKPADYRRLVAAALNPEQIAVVMELLDEQDEARKAGQRARWRKHQQTKNNTNVSQRELTVANVPREGVTRVEDKTSNLDIEPQKKEQKERNALTRDFEDWYAGYPHKVQRGAAERAFPKALSLASLAELKAGVARYIQSKPADRAWQNPSTWLNGKGWLDKPANVVPMARGSPARGVDALINSLLSDMDNADANATTQTQGYPAAPLRISRELSG